MDMRTFILVKGNLYEAALYLTTLLLLFFIININYYTAAEIVNRYDNTCPQLVVFTSPHNNTTATAAAAALWQTPLQAIVHYR